MRLHFLLLLLSLTAALFGHSAWAQVTAPSQGGEVGVVNITATTMELSFGTMGTGQGRVVAIAEAPGGMPVALTAADGQFYNAASTYAKGDTLGEGFVAYNGTGHTVTVTGLQPNTPYYIASSEYNTDGTAIVYNTYGTSTIQSTSTPAPLPVELASFTGRVNAQSIATLYWTTASERNTAYFALERSTDGTVFKETSRMAAAGASNQSRPYQWSDPERLVHPTYYRLRQADHDGTVYYSSIVTLVPTLPAMRLMEVYPNPGASQAMNLLLQGCKGELLTLRLSDTLGRSLLFLTLTPSEDQHIAPLALPLSLAAGTYLLTLTGGISPVQKRIVVSN